MDGILKSDRMLHSMRLIEEVRDASVRSGIQLLKCVKSFINTDENLNRIYGNGKIWYGFWNLPCVICNSI